MRCHEALKLIPDRDDGLLQPGARAALDDHLRTCSAFAAGVLVTLAVQGSPEAPRAPVAEPGEQVVESIPETIKIPAPRSPRRLR